MAEQEPESPQKLEPGGYALVKWLRDLPAACTAGLLKLPGGRFVVAAGRFLWIGKNAEPAPHVWTAEEHAAAWAKGEIPPPEFPDTKFGRLDRRWTAFTKWWSYVAGIGLLSIVVVLVVDVIGWKLFKRPFPSATDFVKHMNVVAVFFAVAYVQTDRGSTAIELFQKHLPNRLKLPIRTFIWILGMATCFYMAYRGYYKTHGQLVDFARSDPPLRFLLWPFGAAMVIGFILLGVSFVVSGIRDLIEFKEKRARYGPGPKKAKKTGAASAAAE